MRRVINPFGANRFIVYKKWKPLNHNIAILVAYGHRRISQVSVYLVKIDRISAIFYGRGLAGDRDPVNHGRISCKGKTRTGDHGRGYQAAGIYNHSAGSGVKDQVVIYRLAPDF